MASPSDLRARIPSLLHPAGLAVLLTVAPAAGAEISGTPQILDGKTLEVAGQRIELFGIDAPELDQVCRHAGRDYQCGQVARAALWDLVAGLDVDCAPATDAPESGPPESGDAVVAECTAGGFSLNENMVHTGWALADRQASDRYVAKEAEAKEARRGLWRGEFELPWEWRASHGDGSSRTETTP